MTLSILIGLASGTTLGLCVAPLWMMLELPMRTVDICDAGTMPMAALALALGATLGALAPAGILPFGFGIVAMGIGGVFVGMLASALTEAVQLVPALFQRLSITCDMRLAAIALAIGKAAGAVIAGLIGG